MVKPFQFARLPKICFKSGMIDELPCIAKTFGNRLILVTGKNSFSRTDYAENLFHSLEKEDIFYRLVTVSGEPSPEVIDQAVNTFSDEEFNLVVGIGGGSVLDAGKAISAMMYKRVPVTEFLEGVGTREHPGTKLPYIAIPTTSGTGSETTKNAVISRVGKNGFKKSLRHDNFVPDIAIVDPRLTLSCPASITAASGMDCFSQLIEAYLSDKSSEYTDTLAMEGLKYIKSSLKESYLHGENIHSREGMSFAALTSGICLANAGLGTVHGFASSIGGMYEIPHGIVCGTLMAKTNEINIRELIKSNDNPVALEKYRMLGHLFLEGKGKSDSYYIDGFISFLEKLSAELQLPGLKKYGLKENDIKEICLFTENKNNPVKLKIDDLIEILTERNF
jgi:alcohol dehydrogenase class IV